HADLCPAALTMGMWVCPGENSSGYQLLAAKTDSSSWQNGYGFVGSSGNSGHLRFFVNGYSTHMAAATVPVGEWTHLVGVFDGKSVRTYLNGKFMHVHKMTSMDPFGDSPFLSDSPLASIKHSNRSLCLGGESSGYSWRGKIDEFVLYNRALSDKEISWLYASVEE
ncbi:MAG: LamG domain-containing protein, partial [Rubripirellula sp.]